MPTYYQIRVKGQLAPHWSAWFDGLTITHNADGNTTLAGPVADQAALYGVLMKIRDRGLSLLEVSQLDNPGLNGAAAPDCAPGGRDDEQADADRRAGGLRQDDF